MRAATLARLERLERQVADERDAVLDRMTDAELIAVIRRHDPSPADLAFLDWFESPTYPEPPHVQEWMASMGAQL